MHSCRTDDSPSSSLLPLRQICIYSPLSLSKIYVSFQKLFLEIPYSLLIHSNLNWDFLFRKNALLVLIAFVSWDETMVLVLIQLMWLRFRFRVCMSDFVTGYLTSSSIPEKATSFIWTALITSGPHCMTICGMILSSLGSTFVLAKLCIAMTSLFVVCLKTSDCFSLSWICLAFSGLGVGVDEMSK